LIVLTNDDGIRSPGLLALYRAVRELGEKTEIVAPAGPQSAAGMSITFYKPLRIEKVLIDGKIAFAVSGSPTDAVFLARYKLFKRREIKLVLSGINLGENLTLQSFYTSGTVSAALAGALNGIKGIAFSMVIDYRYEPSIDEFAGAISYTRKIVAGVLKNGLPEGVDVLSVNFPERITEKTVVKVVPMARTMFDEYVIERRDPRGKSYYWLAGKVKKELDVGTDVHTVLVEKNISITPVSLVNYSKEALEATKKLIDSILGDEKRGEAVQITEGKA
jgi:5'-nucleotidase